MSRDMIAVRASNMPHVTSANMRQAWSDDTAPSPSVSKYRKIYGVCVRDSEDEAVVTRLSGK